MHEFSVAAGIIETVIDEAKKHGAKKVTKIVLEIGPLSMISTEQLKFALGILAEGTIAEGAKTDYIDLPVKTECEKGHHGEVIPEKKDLMMIMSKLICPVCGEKARAVGGRECLIKEITAE